MTHSFPRFQKEFVLFEDNLKKYFVHFESKNVFFPHPNTHTHTHATLLIFITYTDTN